MRIVVFAIVIVVGSAVGRSESVAAANAADAGHGTIAVLPAAKETTPGAESQTSLTVPVTPVAVGVVVGDGWRYRWYGGRWWYWLPENRWVYSYGNQWLNYVPSAQAYTYYYTPNYSYNYAQPYYTSPYYNYTYPRAYPRYYGGYGPRVYAGSQLYGGYRSRW